MDKKFNIIYSKYRLIKHTFSLKNHYLMDGLIDYLKRDI